MFQIKNILHFLFPGGVLFIGCAVILYTDAWLRIESSHIDIIGLILLAFGLFLGWRFDRNRLLYALLLLLAADISDRWFISLSTFTTLHQVIAVLVPLNFILIGLMREKGSRSFYSFTQMSLLPLQAGLIYWWLTYGNSAYFKLLNSHFLPAPFNIVPDALIAAFIVAMAIQIIRYFRYQNPIETAFVWAILCSSIAGVLQPGTEATLFRIFSALIIIISVFEMSYALAYRDELTALPSRRALNEAFTKLGGQYSVAMADIDHFKKLNDTYGHDVGDQVLRMVAARMEKCASGPVYRYGGEEFCLVFPGCNRDETMEPLEELRKAIADNPFLIRQKLRPIKKPKSPKKRAKTSRTVMVTISIGVAEKSRDLKTPEDVMKVADQALYRAKKAGRNRVRK